MKVIFTILFTLTLGLAIGQTTIRGKVTDNNGQPIPMANVFLKDSYDGATTDETGAFEFQTSETGSKIVLVKFIGYADLEISVVLEGKTITLSPELKEQISELKAVTISAGAFTASDESRRTVFRAVDIATTAGATADIAGALNTLPGTQKVGETGRLFVRGGEGNEAKTFIDGLVVLDAFSPSAPNTPSRGRFLPFMFKGTSFSTGGYSAEYGQALSAALVLDSKDESGIDRTDIGLLSVGGDVTHTQAWDGGSIGGKIQYTNLKPYMGLINQEIDWKTAPVSTEGIGAFRQRVGDNGIVKVYGNFTQSDYSLYQHDIEDSSQTTLYDLSNNYKYLNGFYKNTLNSNWMLRGGLSYTFIKNDIGIADANVNELEKGLHGKVVLDGSLSDQIELKSGVEVITRDYSQELETQSGSSQQVSFNETITALFTESDLYASNKFVTRVGARAEYNSLNKTYALDPRISLAYKTGENGQVSLAYGTFRQSVKNEYLKFNNDLKSERASHYILNYQRISDNKTFRIETYYKVYDDLLKVEGDVFANQGKGYARGIELFWRDNRSVKNLDYWISYSFLDTERDYLNFPSQAVPAFASKHNFSIVGKYFVTNLKSQLGATYSFTSGRPYENPNESGFNTSKTPSYQDLSFTWSYLPKPYLIVFFSCTNLLGRDNIFGYEYGDQLNEQGQYNSRAIRQPAPRFLFLGIFLTLSKDKSVNQLPTL
jgi:hypothetical protein